MPATILLYEDDLDLREFVTSLLEEQGYTVVSTESLQDADLVTVCTRVDLFLADSGESSREHAMEVFRRVCGTAGKDVPVIMFTAHRIVKEEAEEAGCADVIQKPFDIGDLLRQVEEHLKQRV